MEFDPQYFVAYLPALMRGLLMTLQVSSVAIAASLVLGVAGGAVRYLRVPVASPIIAIVVEFIRNTPPLVQIFFVCFGLPAIGVHLSLFWSGVLSLAVWAAAFHIESVRGSCAGVPRGLEEAGEALGLHRWRVLWLVILPMALRACVPSMLNTSISLLKNSALLQAVGLVELTFIAIDRISSDFRMLEMFSALLVIYVALVALLSYGASRIEHVLARPFRA